MTAIDILDLGTASGQNHFKLQWNPDPPPTGTPLEQDPGAITEHPPYFETGGDPAGTAARFRTSMNGSRTSTYPRCELREMNETGTTEMAFNTATGDHWLQVQWRILHLPPVKPTCNVLQLHGGDAEGDRIQITAELTSGVVKLKVRLNGTSSGQPLLEDPLELGKWYTTMIRMLGGQAYVYHQDMTTPIALVGNLTNHSTLAYFKTGCYPNSNDTIDTATEYALVELRRPMHWHTGWALPKPLREPAAASATPPAVALSPARTTAANSSAVTSAAFNPPACLLIAVVHGSAGTQANPTLNMSNNGAALTWTQLARATRTQTGGSSSNNGMVAIYAAKLTAARTGMTVTASQNSGSSPTSIKPYCVTGHDTAAATPWANALIGRALTNGVTTTPYTPTQAGSLLIAAASEWVPRTPAPTAADLTAESALLGSGPNLGVISGYRQVTVPDPQSVAFDAGGTSAADWMWATVEILAPPAAAADAGGWWAAAA